MPWNRSRRPIVVPSRRYQKRIGPRLLGERSRAIKDETFATYSKAAKNRIAPYQFKKPMQLKKDPQKQTAWTNWLEYLNYELRWLESWTTAADALESKYQESTKKLRDALLPEGDDDADGAVSGPSASQQGFPVVSRSS